LNGPPSGILRADVCRLERHAGAMCRRIGFGVGESEIAILHGTKVEVPQANDDSYIRSDDAESLSYDPSTPDIPESVEANLNILLELMDFILDEAGDIDVTEFDD